MSPVVVKLRTRTLAESLALRVHAGYKPRKGWQDARACVNLDSELVLPVVCPGCPVRLDCLAYTMRAEQQHPNAYIVGHAALPAADRVRFRLPWETPVEHGTRQGYHRHHRNGETPCGPCLEAYARWREHHRPSRAGQRRKTAQAVA